MEFNRFRFVIIFRVLVLVFSIVPLGFTIYKPGLIMLSGLILLLIGVQIFSLIRYLEHINRDLKRFLESIQFSDFSVTFSGPDLGPAFREVKEEYNRVTKEFQKIRSEKEERFLYFQTVVEHVGTGLISFTTNGEIEFINKAALYLLNVKSLRNINNLDKVNGGLAHQLRNVKPGERTLFKQNLDGHEVHLAVTATQFILRQQKYTLVTLQNIQSEVERERIVRELEIGQEVQDKLLPKYDSEIPGFDIASYYKPAKEVGGDYYDLIRIDESHLGIVIGDVSGKGLPAAIYMTFTKGIMQAYIKSGFSAAKALSKANELIYDTIAKKSFISMIVAILNTETREMTFARAGHNPLIYLNGQGIQELNSSGVALGLSDHSIFDTEIAEVKLQLASDDVIVLYTDGMNEAMNSKQQEYSTQCILDLVYENKTLAAAKIISKLEHSLSDFTGDIPQHDDRTALVLKVK